MDDVVTAQASTFLIGSSLFFHLSRTLLKDWTGLKFCRIPQRTLGHTRVTHSYLLLGEEHPQCVGCDAPFTVRHFLLECRDFAQVRNNCFHVANMKELFQDIHIDSIMTF